MAVRTPKKFPSGRKVPKRLQKKFKAQIKKIKSGNPNNNKTRRNKKRAKRKKKRSGFP